MPILGPGPVANSKPAKPAPPSAGFFNSELYSDITIKFGDREIKAHRLQLHLATPYFQNTFSKDFAEASMPTVELKDDDEDGVQAMLEFIYRHTYTIPADVKTQEELLEFHIAVYMVGDKYRVQALCDLALTNFAQLAVFDLFDPKTSLPAYKLAAEMIYNHGFAQGDALRQKFVSLSVAQPEFLGKYEFEMRTLHKGIPELAMDIMAAYVKKAILPNGDQGQSVQIGGWGNPL